jgi:hypothetical protein
MSAMVDGRIMHSAYVRVKCPCGRDLRARPEQAGGHITCWSCHGSVFVPVPVAPGSWVVRVLRVTARQILEARTFTLLAVGAVLVTLALGMTGLGVSPGPAVRAWIPRPGVWAAALALALVMVGYGELLRRGCEGDWAPRPAVGPLALAWRVFLCLGAGVILALPMIMESPGSTPPHLTATGLVVGLAASLILPLILLGTFAPRGTVSDRVCMVASMLKRHPAAVLATLLLLPLSLPAIEGLVFVLTRLSSKFAFMLFDLFPPHAGIRTFSGLPYYALSESRLKWLDFREAGDTLILGTYLGSLAQGYTLIGSIPASLAMDTSRGYLLLSVDLNPHGYLAVRMVFTLVIVTCILCVLAIQARWLGLLSTIDSRRSASSGSTGLFQLPDLTPETP